MNRSGADLFAQEAIGAGQPLDSGTRAWMESQLSHDFSAVRVHTGGAAAESAEGLHARAYTVGGDVVFAAGEFAPSTTQGRALLAHELTHVVQQARGASAAIQRAPARGNDFRNDSTAAKYRGEVMAKRIRTHGKLSKEARAKIQSELAYFEGAARSAYLKNVNPALKAVHEEEIPDDYGVMTGTPKPITLLDPTIHGPTVCGPGGCLTDYEANAPFREQQQRDEAEKQARIQAQVDELQAKMTHDWRPEDKAFALDFLTKVLAANPNPDPRGVSDKIRQPLMDRLRKELENIDAQRKAICAKGDPGFIERARRAGNNDDPCVSWFATPDSHGPNTLNELARQLKIERGASEDAADQVYWDVFQYRKLSDPALIQLQELTNATLQGLAGVAGGIGEQPPVSEPITTPEPPTTGTGTTISPGPDPVPIQGGGQTTPQTRQGLGVVDPAPGGGDVVRPVSPKPKTPPSPAQPDQVQQQQQKIAAGGGGGGQSGAGQTKMAVKPKTPRPDYESGRRPPTVRDLTKDPSMSELADELEGVSQSRETAKKGSKQMGEKQQIIKAGQEIESPTVQAWAQKQPKGATVYRNADLPPEIKSIYPETKGAAQSGPDAVSIDAAKSEITVFDSTTKPTPEHTTKTVRDAQKLKDNLPEQFKGYKIFAQEGWTDGGLKVSPKKPI